MADLNNLDVALGAIMESNHVDAVRADELLRAFAAEHEWPMHIAVLQAIRSRGQLQADPGGSSHL